MPLSPESSLSTEDLKFPDNQWLDERTYINNISNISPNISCAHTKQRYF